MWQIVASGLCDGGVRRRDGAGRGIRPGWKAKPGREKKRCGVRVNRTGKGQTGSGARFKTIAGGNGPAPDDPGE